MFLCFLPALILHTFGLKLQATKKDKTGQRDKQEKKEQANIKGKEVK